MVYENSLHFSTQTVAKLGLHLLLFNIKHMRLYVALHNRQLCLYCRYKQYSLRFSVSSLMLALCPIIKAESTIAIKHLLQGIFSLDFRHQPLVPTLQCIFPVGFLRSFCLPCCMRLIRKPRDKRKALLGFLLKMFKSRKIVSLL